MQPLRIYADQVQIAAPTGPTRARMAVVAPRELSFNAPHEPSTAVDAWPAPQPALQLVPRTAAAPAMRAPAISQREAMAPETETRMTKTLETRGLANETVSATYQRIEQELGTQFASLTVLQARELHRRLSTPRADDALATAFHRMVAERKGRLLAFLADARRREALARAVAR